MKVSCCWPCSAKHNARTLSATSASTSENHGMIWSLKRKKRGLEDLAQYYFKDKVPPWILAKDMHRKVPEPKGVQLLISTTYLLQGQPS